LSSPLELLLEPVIESDTLPDEAEPALEADEAKLSAWAGRAMAAARMEKPASWRRNGFNIGNPVVRLISSGF
jgi:hypothetical protein